jgi:hypothetical protein
MPEIRFIPESHTYLVDGEPKLSVTQVLDANGMYPEFGKNAAAARFGTIGHKIVKMEIDGKLSGYDPAFEPYMVGIRKFIEEQKPVYDYMEAMRYSEKDDFVGTVDFVGYAGQETILRKLILDWKFWSAPQKILLTLAGYQTAGYSRLFFGAVPVRRAVVHFYPEGYTILPLRDPLDSVAFQSLLNVAKLKLKMGIYKPKGQTDDE